MNHHVARHDHCSSVVRCVACPTSLGQTTTYRFTPRVWLDGHSPPESGQNRHRETARHVGASPILALGCTGWVPRCRASSHLFGHSTGRLPERPRVATLGCRRAAPPSPPRHQCARRWGPPTRQLRRPLAAAETAGVLHRWGLWGAPAGRRLPAPPPPCIVRALGPRAVPTIDVPPLLLAPPTTSARPSRGRTLRPPVPRFPRSVFGARPAEPSAPCSCRPPPLFPLLMRTLPPPSRRGLPPTPPSAGAGGVGDRKSVV